MGGCVLLVVLASTLVAKSTSAVMAFTKRTFSLLASALLCAPFAGIATAVPTIAPVVPGAYIVEFENGAADTVSNSSRIDHQLLPIAMLS